MKVAVGIATAGRRDQLRLTLEQLERQTTSPQRVLVCPASADDFDESSARRLRLNVAHVSGGRGLCVQRNAILRECASEDIIVFFDDDFYPAQDYIEQVSLLFSREDDIVLASHHPILDGATSRGISHEEAIQGLERIENTLPVAPCVRPVYAGYGCNMVVRLSPVREHGIWFDENLPLYSWLEDVDFSRRIANYGRVVEYNRLSGVHLGTKGGRTSGVRLGYSQIANPMYMLQKGSLSTSYALRQIGRNVAKNVLRCLWPEPWVDRAGRFRGNTLAICDLMAHRLHPMKVTEIE